MNGEVVVTDDVAGAFATTLVEAFRARSRETFALALCGGDTARLCYERLAADAAESIDWWQVDVYWGDERCVPPDDSASNQLLGRQVLLEQVGAANSVHPMRCSEPEAYQLLLGEIGFFDVVHLGMGADGHTASLFPGSPALDADPGQLVALNEDPTGRNPHRRMTLTFAGIARARLAVVTVVGGGKADALRRLRAGEDLPAGRIQAERVLWLIDPAAAP